MATSGVVTITAADMNDIKCIFCETESSDVVIEENGYEGKKCPQCGLIYISPRPSFDDIVDLYGHGDAHISAKSHISNEFSTRLYARHHLKIIRSFIKNGAVLEIGAGAGYFLDEARKVGFSPYALEFNPIQASHIREKLGIPCEETPLSAEIHEGTQFDLIYHCDVISHLFDPISDFKNIHERLKDESYLIFETGNLGEVDKTYFKYYERFQYPDHLFFFSTDNLVDLLEKTGFDLVKIYKYSILPQLTVMKAWSGIKGLVKQHVLQYKEKEKRSSGGRRVDMKSVANLKSPNATSLLKEGAERIHQSLNYVLRYKIGRIAPKAHRPQTVIVVAKKTSSRLRAAY